MIINLVPHANALCKEIDPAAIIVYTATPAAEAVTFDTEGGTFTHTGSLCTFETMIQAFELDDVALQTVGEIVHAIDLNDGQYAHPEIPGLATVLEGWLHLDIADAEREAWGRALFEGLYQAVAHRLKPR